MEETTINIVYLYAELQPYVIAVIRELVKQKNISIYVIHWDKKRLTPYVPPQIDRVYYYNRSHFKNVKELYQLTEKIEPTIIYTSGWMDKGYMLVCKKLRKEFHIPVVSGSDTQWRGGKQWINVILSPFLHRRCFSHIMISGILQYEYARKLGFRSNEILLHNCCADVSLFQNVNIEQKEKSYPRRVLYVGRFAPEKGLPFLIEAWTHIMDKKGWILTLVGNGTLKPELLKNDDIEILDFMPQDELVKLMQKTGCFILPSVFEQWSLVLHEATAAGLPILSSEVCGAVPYFVIPNFNGFTFRSKDVGAIEKALLSIVNSSEIKLLEMSRNSRKLSERITPEIVAKTFLSVL
jgi:glycosyltransferase involved in cell wall biosynthesis